MRFAVTVAIAAGYLPLAAAPAGAADPAPVAGSEYYVDCSRPDNGDGSRTSPWNTLHSVNATEFNPGDRILFARGTRCDGTLAPQGSGASGAPIVVDAYGDGAKPVIAGGDAQDAVVLSNQQYWEIQNLEVTNHGASAEDRHGVRIVLKDYGTGNHYRLANLTVHDVNSGGQKGLGPSYGIFFEVLGNSVKTKFNDVVVDGSNIYTVGSGINMSTTWKCRASMGWEDACANQVYNYYPWTGFVVQNNTVHDIGGDGIVMQHTENGLAQNNVSYDTSARPLGDTAAMWVWNADHVTFQYNEAYRTHKLGDNGDGMAWDADYGTDGTLYQYNYSHDNAGGMAMFCGCSDTGAATSTTTNATFRYNVSQNDGNSDANTKVSQVLRGYGTSTGWFYNNTIYVPSGSSADILFAHPKSHVTVANNIIVNNSNGGYESDNVRFSNNILSGSNTSNVPPGQIIANPQLASPGSGGTGFGSVAGYQLTAGSPALGAGLVITDNGGRDYWRNPVPTVCAPDIGAHQYSAPDDASCPGSGPLTGPIAPGVAGK
ncbi:hypothetical protein ACFZDG_39510 [Kitasatospora xanthocidica]|uniref:hypothetical protein n=1 Tax=Kitasatospora xanthocidica TaxID=83382 RepID=UPI0036E9CA49